MMSVNVSIRFPSARAKRPQPNRLLNLHLVPDTGRAALACVAAPRPGFDTGQTQRPFSEGKRPFGFEVEGEGKNR